MGEDFLCAYEPKGGPVIQPLGAPLDADAKALIWTPEAEAWLARIPSFVRRFVRQRAESQVRANHGREVTAEVMVELAQVARGRLGGRPPISGGAEQ